MGKNVDLIGDKYNYLTVEKLTENRNNRKHYICICDCGNKVTVSANNLRSGSVKSCGCLHKKNIKKTHGKTGTSEYNIWKTIKQRTLNSSNDNFYLYGGRGIGLSKEWEDSFETFLLDMGPRPTPKHSIERRDNEKGYSKENCYWATPVEQARNRRNNRYIEYKNFRKTLTTWCEELGLSYSLILKRLNLGWTFEESINTPLQEPRKILFKGENRTVKDISELTNIPIASINEKIRNGWTIDNIFKHYRV